MLTENGRESEKKKAEMRKIVCWSHMMRINPMALIVAHSLYAVRQSAQLRLWLDEMRNHRKIYL